MGSERSVVPGDWVRFYQGGKLVLGIVSYVRERERYPHTTEALTDVGAVEIDSIVEVRHADA